MSKQDVKATIEFTDNFDVTNLTTFKIGGEISKMYFPKNEVEFLEVMNLYKTKSGMKVFGNFSNTLVSSYGYDGFVVSTSKINEVTVDGTKIFAGCGVKGPMLAKIAAKNGLSGLEFMIGFPGSIGGEVFMNASAHGQEIAEVVQNVTLYSPQKGIFKLSKSEMEFGYRKSVCHENPFIVLGVEFKLEKKSVDDIEAKMSENIEFRKTHQPMMTLGNAGSIFKNPQGNSAGRLLEEVGAKELSIGGVKVWENHANFIVNHRAGTSLDVLELMFQMYSRVKDKFNIELEPEIIFLGGNNEKEVELCKILYRN